MFENLSDKIMASLKKVRGQNRITESNVEDVIKEIRLSLLGGGSSILKSSKPSLIKSKPRPLALKFCKTSTLVSSSLKSFMMSW